MIKIFEYIDKLDKSGNFRLADKLDNEIRKIYAQAVMQTPAMQGENQFSSPYFAFKLNELLTQKEPEDTDTLSPTKNNDVATIRKQLNKLISDGNITSKKIKTIENDLGALPALEGKAGKASEQIEELSTNVTDNTFNISENSQDIQVIQDTLDTL